MGALPEDLQERLHGVRSVGVVTGAGISAESGVPTYRGRGGIYDDPETGNHTVEALSRTTLYADPDRTWGAIADLARQSGHAAPNAAHHALVEMEASVDRFVLLTQNIDGLHQAAGSRNVIAIHGDASQARCMQCAHTEAVDLLDPPRVTPHCPLCGGSLRPDVVLFGEMLDPLLVSRITAELLIDPPDLVLSIGTSSQFPYIVEPVVRAAAAGKLTIEINPERTQVTTLVDYHLPEKASEALPRICRTLERPRTP